MPLFSTQARLEESRACIRVIAVYGTNVNTCVHRSTPGFVCCMGRGREGLWIRNTMKVDRMPAVVDTALCRHCGSSHLKDASQTLAVMVKGTACVWRRARLQCCVCHAGIKTMPSGLSNEPQEGRHASHAGWQQHTRRDEMRQHKHFVRATRRNRRRPGQPGEGRGRLKKSQKDALWK